MSETKQKLFAINLVSVGIDGSENGDFYGRIWEPYEEDAQNFNGINDMLFKIDDLYDKWNYPQRALNKRSLVKKEIKKTPINVRALDLGDKIDKVQEKSGDIATFVIQVRYRQRATWQGKVIFSEKNIKADFKSELELIKFIDDCMKNYKQSVEKG